MFTPDAIKWGDAPPNVPTGAKLAVLYGDPAKDGLFLIRVKLPANYKIAHALASDGRGRHRAERDAHFVLTKQPGVIEISSMGPLAFTYVNPADDPSKK